MLTFPVIAKKEPPLQLMTLDAFAEFVWFFMADADVHKLRAQKEREERIERRFTLAGTEPAHQSIQRRWVESWNRATPELERIRCEDIRRADTTSAIIALDGPFEAAREQNKSKPTSGLIQQQQLFRQLAS